MPERRSVRVTVETLDIIESRINALSDTFRAIAFPGGRPDWMAKEQWTEIAGEKE